MNEKKIDSVRQTNFRMTGTGRITERANKNKNDRTGRMTVGANKNKNDRIGRIIERANKNKNDRVCGKIKMTGQELKMLKIIEQAKNHKKSSAVIYRRTFRLFVKSLKH